MKPKKFLKKMKTALKMQGGAEKAPTAAALDLPTAKAQGQQRLSFINKLVSGKFMQQLVDKIQNMVKAQSSITASLDFKSVDFGDMKLAAEATGSKLAIKLAGIGQALSSEIVAMKSDLEVELKHLGFDDVDIDFGDSGRSDSEGKNPFEEELQRRVNKDPVKLPGDYLADLGKIDEWLKDYEKVV